MQCQINAVVPSAEACPDAGTAIVNDGVRDAQVCGRHDAGLRVAGWQRGELVTAEGVRRAVHELQSGFAADELDSCDPPCRDNVAHAHMVLEMVNEERVGEGEAIALLRHALERLMPDAPTVELQ